jgi:hypothetical protein
MDDDKDDKNLIEKTMDAVKGIATSVTDAAKSAMEPKPDPEQVAGTTNEQVYIPETTDPAPLIMGAPPAKKKRKALAKPAPPKMPPKKAAAKKSSKKAAKKTAKKSSKKSAKEPKSLTRRKTVGKKKTAKKIATKKKTKR